MNDKFLSLLPKNDTGGTPREVIHFPERIKRKEERESRNGKDIEKHPANHVPFSAEDKDESL